MKKLLLLGLSSLILTAGCSKPHLKTDTQSQPAPAPQADPVPEPEPPQQDKSQMRQTSSNPTPSEIKAKIQMLEKKKMSLKKSKSSTNHSRSFVFEESSNLTSYEQVRHLENASVIGYLDSPTPVYILDSDPSQDLSPGNSQPAEFNTEEYDRIYENPFLKAMDNPVSTFSIDVDAASYANTRRFLNENRMPPADAVRIEEFINYFSYDYPPPDDQAPFSVHTEISECPWKQENRLLKIGIKGKEIETKELPPSNLVFLLDVSGSMSSRDKLPLLQKAFGLLVDRLREQDKVSIAVYAGSAGLVLPPTSGAKKTDILDAINKLRARGSTAGGEGILLAYETAKKNFVKGGTNRVILATDGDFNVGVSSDAELVRLIEKKREEGVFLTVLGFGSGNYKDSKMEQLANKGNGNYAYIDNILEAKKVLVNEIGGTLVTIAKDVKIQIEFNPVNVKSYRLIGYENRVLNKEDFDDDKKDAGELGAGHEVTALYELVLADSAQDRKSTLRYQESRVTGEKSKAGEVAYLKLRYKHPEDTVSQLIENTINDESYSLEQTTDDFRFACAVAGFGMLLRDSEHKGNADYPMIKTLARNALGQDA
ncbi:MAG: vWA domain-containing protein, partial [Fibrobacterota bacterium]